MVEIEYLPLQKIVIHDIELSPLDRFVDHSAGRGGSLGWCNGMLFSIQHFPPDPDLIKDSIKGIHHWQVVEVAQCEKFQTEMKNKSNLSIQVLDQSHNEVLVDAIKKVREVLKLD